MQLLALSEPESLALFLTVFGLLMGFCALFAKALARSGVPIVLVFLILGMLGGSQGIGGVEFDNFRTAFRIGAIALVFILFDGGLNTTMDSIRRSAGPASVLATVAVALTAGAVALIGRLLGLPWPEAILIGSIVSSTDAAAVFATLRGSSIRVKEKIRATLEVESCANDPMAVILTVATVEAIQASALPGWSLLWDVPVQLAVGTAIGIVVGCALKWSLNHILLPTTGLYPVVTFAFAFIAFGVATLVNGSGFLAVFAAGVVVGNAYLPYRAGLSRVHDAIAWMSQVTMFLMLGLLVVPSTLLSVVGVGLLMGLGLACVARPLAVTLCLLPFRWPWKEIGYVSWVGIRGAVPIILGTIPVMVGIEGGDRVFHIVFFIVVLSALAPGASIVPITRWLKLEDQMPPTPSAALELHSLRRMSGEIHAYHIEESVLACGLPLSQIRFPKGAAAILIVRGDELMAARGDTVCKPGDHIYVFCRPGDEPQIGLIFGKTAAV